MNTFFLDRLNSEPHALAFAGQSTPWPVALADQSANPALDEALHTHAAAAQALLYPVSAALLATTGRPVDLFGFEPNPARLGAAAAASASDPGLALTQLGALRDIDFVIYPYTSASTTLAAYAPIGAGFPFAKLDESIGIMKAYSSCVG